MQFPHPYIHRITPQAVDLEAQAIAMAAGKGGYNPSGLDFSGPAAQRLVDDVLATADAIGVPVTRRDWARSRDGGIEIAILTDRELDVVKLRLALS